MKTLKMGNNLWYALTQQSNHVYTERKVSFADEAWLMISLSAVECKGYENCKFAHRCIRLEIHR